MSNGINNPYGLIAVESMTGGQSTSKMTAYRFIADRDGAVGTLNIVAGDPVKFYWPTNDDALNYQRCGKIVPAYSVSGDDDLVAELGGFLGTFIACQYKRSEDLYVTESSFLPAGLVIEPYGILTVFVNDDPNTIYKVQMSTSDKNVNEAAFDEKPSSIFQQWMIGQNANLNIISGKFDNILPDNDFMNKQNPEFSTKNSCVYLDGKSISFISDGDDNLGNVDYDVKIIGLAPSSYPGRTTTNQRINLGDVNAPDIVTQIPGFTMPFCDVLVKFNNHIYGSTGTPGPFRKKV